MSAVELLLPQDVIELAADLRDRGFSIGVGECISAQRLMISLSALGPSGIGQDKLATWLAPIFCTTPAEQERFYKHYAEWLAEKTSTPTAAVFAATPDKTDGLHLPFYQRIAAWQWICLAAAVGLIVLLGLAAHQVYELLVTRTLTGTVVDEGNHRVANAVINLKAQRIISGTDGSFTVQFRLYDLPTKLIATSPASQAIPTAGTLTVNRKNFRQTRQLQLHPQHVNAGDYADRKQRPRIPVVTTPISNPWQQLFFHLFPWIRAALVAIPILAVLGWLFWVYLPRLQLVRWTSASLLGIENLFVSNFERYLYNNTAFRRTAQGLRRHKQVVSLDLDAERTVSASAQNAGWFTPVRGLRQTLPEYLVLIDRISNRDMQSHLLEELVCRLRLENVPVERYYFCEDPRFCHNDRPEKGPILLQDLAAKFAAQTLLVFADGAGMFNPLTGRVYPWMDLFSAWSERIFLLQDDPLRAAGLTSSRRRVLEDRGFFVLPATDDGLSRLAEHIHTGEIPQSGGVPKSQSYPELLLEGPLRWVGRLPPDSPRISRLLGQVRRYLGTQSFYWLAACAVYPELSWDLTLYLGQQLQVIPGDQSRLSALIRLPWFRYGTIPDWLRERLVAAIPSEIRNLIRGRLKHILLTALDHPEDPIVLRVAVASESTSAPLSRWKDMLLKNFMRTEPTSSPLHDYVLVKFLYGSRSSSRSVEVPQPVQNLLRRYAQPRRPFIQVSLAIALTVTTAMILSHVNPPKPPDPLIGYSPGVRAKDQSSPPLSSVGPSPAASTSTPTVSSKELPGLLELVKSGGAHIRNQNGALILCLNSAPATGNSHDAVSFDPSDPSCPYQRRLVFPNKADGSPCTQCEILSDTLGETSPGRSSSHVATKFGSVDATEDYYKMKVTYNERAFGENAPQVAAALRDLATFYLNDGRNEIGEPLLQRALQIDRNTGDKNAAMSDLSDIGRLYVTLKRYPEAEISYQEGLSLARALGDLYNVTDFLNNLASLYVNEGRYDQATESFNDALSVGEQASGKYSSQVIDSLVGLASLYVIQKNYKEAEALYRRVVTIDQRSPEVSAAEMAKDLRALSAILQAQGSNSEAKKLLDNALEIEKSVEAAQSKYASTENPPPILTGGTLVPLSCEKLKSLKSQNDAQSTTVQFVNSTSTLVYVYWIDFDGHERLYYNLPGQRIATVDTYVTHPWVIKDDGGNCLAIFLPINKPASAEITESLH